MVGTAVENLDLKSSYDARPKPLRYCIGPLWSRSLFILTSPCHLRYASSIAMNSSSVTPLQSQP